jgi:Bax protein
MLYPFFSKPLPLQTPSVPQPLPDFASLDVPARKAEFFAYLRPIVAVVSSDVDEERTFVLETRGRVAAGKGLTGAQRARVTALVDRYDVDAEGDAPIETVLSQLAERVDIIPTSLVLVQAATESAWGTSRFAVEGNSLFGQRCYDTGCGLVPAGRTNPNFSVKVFASVEDSVRSYVHNINTHSQYAEFRRERSAQRERGEPLGSIALAATLVKYSERRLAYVSDIRALIEQTGLAPHD